MKINAVENDFTFPYLYDESQEVARAYDAHVLLIFMFMILT